MPEAVARVYHTAPARARKRMLALRELILVSAKRCKAGAVEETLKWGEPAYRVAGGSPVRIGWKPKTPNQVAMYFICTTNLVDHFRALYPTQFRFSGNRALVFDLDAPLPTAAVKHCVTLAMSYHAKR